MVGSEPIPSYTAAASPLRPHWADEPSLDHAVCGAEKINEAILSAVDTSGGLVCETVARAHLDDVTRRPQGRQVHVEAPRAPSAAAQTRLRDNGRRGPSLGGRSEAATSIFIASRMIRVSPFFTVAPASTTLQHVAPLGRWRLVRVTPVRDAVDGRSGDRLRKPRHVQKRHRSSAEPAMVNDTLSVHQFDAVDAITDSDDVSSCPPAAQSVHGSSISRRPVRGATSEVGRGCRHNRSHEGRLRVLFRHCEPGTLQVQKSSMHSPFTEARMLENLKQERQIGADAEDRECTKRRGQPRDRQVACFGRRDHLAREGRNESRLIRLRASDDANGLPPRSR